MDLFKVFKNVNHVLVCQGASKLHGVKVVTGYKSPVSHTKVLVSYCVNKLRYRDIFTKGNSVLIIFAKPRSKAKVYLLSGTVRARQPEGESPKFQKPQISSSGVAKAWGHAIKLKSLVKICSFALNQRN